MTPPEDPYRGGSPEQPPVWQPSPSYGPPPAAYGQGYLQGYGQPPAYAGPPSTSSQAIIALVLAIGSFVVFPLVPAIVALCLVPGAREQIDLSGGRVGGDGLLTATKVVAWINIGLCVGGLLIGLALLGLFVSVGFS